jgi:hypothetical protein
MSRLKDSEKILLNKLYAAWYYDNFTTKERKLIKQNKTLLLQKIEDMLQFHPLTSSAHPACLRRFTLVFK